jgi:hypothetical protein
MPPTIPTRPNRIQPHYRCLRQNLEFFGFRLHRPDTRSQGAFAVDSFSNDGDGSLKMQTFDNTSQGKVSVVFEASNPATALGTLGDLSQLSVDFFKSSNPATPSANQFAYRIWLNSTGSLSLVWENNYNGNASVPLDTWQTVNLAGGNFWQGNNGTNFNGGAEAVSLSQWTGGAGFTVDGNNVPAISVPLSASTQVFGLEIAYGSGVGPFTGYVDNVNIGFASGATFSADVTAAATPLPASLWGGMFLIAGLGAFHTYRKRATA